MIYTLFPDQQQLYDRINTAWTTNLAVLAVSGTGSGKTIIGTQAIKDHAGKSCIIAHKMELLANMSETLAKRGIPHHVVTNPKNEGIIRRNNIRKTGKDWLAVPIRAKVIIVSIQTISSRKENREFLNLVKNVTFAMIDEAHHAVMKNSYGLVFRVFPRLIKILGLTGSPKRTDGLGLGVHHDGIFNVLLEGASQRELMDIGRISSWKVLCDHTTAETALEEARIPRNNKGDLNLKKQAEILAGTTIVGDIVKTYINKGEGLPAAIYLPSIELSIATADKFNAAGVKAVHLDGGTDGDERAGALVDLENGVIQVVCNVGLFDEGVNIPCLKYVALAFRTVSLIKYLQIWGRVLRKGRPGILADHCGNFNIHGRPDDERNWTLDRETKKQDKSDVIPLRFCENAACTGNGMFERWLASCPFCGWIPPVKPAEVRVAPKQVEGDLTLLTPEMLNEISEDFAYLQKTDEEIKEEFLEKTYGDELVTRFNVARVRKNRVASNEFSDLIWTWRIGNEVLSDSEAHKWFWFNFGTTIPEALGKKTAEIKKLMEKFKEATK